MLKVVGATLYEKKSASEVIETFPLINLDWELMTLVFDANRAMGELFGAGQLLPNPHLLIRPYLRREAILSSLIVRYPG